MVPGGLLVTPFHSHGIFVTLAGVAIMLFGVYRWAFTPAEH